MNNARFTFGVDMTHQDVDKWVDGCWGDDSSTDTEGGDLPYRVHVVERVHEDDQSEEEDAPPLEERVLDSSDSEAEYDSDDSSDEEDF